MRSDFAINDSNGSVFAWGAVAFLFAASFATLFHLNQSAYIRFGAEDSIIENLSALFYAVAGLLILISCARHWHEGARGVLTVLLGLFFIFVAGEEISWGQRIFSFDTPESIAELNTQSELNLHNLQVFDKNQSFLNQHTLLNVFVLLNGVLIPLAYLTYPFVRKVLLKIRFPVAPLASVPFFVLGLLYGQTVSKIWPHWSHPEYKEWLYAAGFLLFGLFVWNLTSHRESQ